VPDNSRPRFRQFTRQGRDITCRDTRFLLRPGGRVRTNETVQGIQILEPPAGEFRIVEPFVQEHMDHCQIQSIVRSRSDHQEPVSLGRGNRGPDVDHREPAALLHAIKQIIDLLDVDRFEQVAGLEHHMAGVLQIINNVFATEAEEGKGCMMDVARTGDIVIAVIGRTKTLHERHVEVTKRTAAIRKKDAAPPVPCHDFLQPLRNIIQRFVPGRPPPSAFAPLAFPDERVLGAFVVVYECYPGTAPRTNGAIDPGRMRVAANEGALTPFNLDLNRAADRAHATDTID